MDVFYREWERRAPGETRDLGRARALADALGLLDPDVPVLTVVGSKGKGTAATYASAFLAAAGLRVCTVTSPGLRSDRDRIRLDGRALSPDELAASRDVLEQGIAKLPPPSRGYLAPTGLFTLSGVLRARAAGADVIVLEAGMGGRSDEASLFEPAVAAITPIFLEHAHLLGATPAEIAKEKLGVAGPGTTVLSAPQSAEVAEALGAAVERVPPGASGLPSDLLPEGLGRTNAELGVTAARRLPGIAEPAPEALRGVLGSIVLPGRLSWHDVPGTATRLLVDSAIDRTGVAAALAAARRAWDAIDHVVVCLPDHKDLDGAIAELRGLPVTFARLPWPRLRFTRPLPPAWDVVDADAVTRESLAALGRRVVVLGTVYFTGHVLTALDVSTERLFVTAAARRPS